MWKKLYWIIVENWLCLENVEEWECRYIVKGWWWL